MSSEQLAYVLDQHKNMMHDAYTAGLAYQSSVSFEDWWAYYCKMIDRQYKERQVEFLGKHTSTILPALTKKG